MDHQEKTVLLKNGKPCLLRQAEESDAEMLVEYLKTTSGETPYMLREPEEVRAIFFSMAPFLPMIIPLWLAFSQ